MKEKKKKGKERHWVRNTKTDIEYEIQRQTDRKGDRERNDNSGRQIIEKNKEKKVRKGDKRRRTQIRD